MTDTQEAHLLEIKTECSALLDAKYRKGQEEHGGDLFKMDPSELLANAIDEAIDQVVYLLTLRKRLRL